MLKYSLRLLPPIALLTLFLPLITSLPYTPRDVIGGTKLRILPLGDSITFGSQPNKPNGTNGYRAELANRLSGSDFLFVGTQRSGDMADNYNEGHPGYTISQITGVMGPALDMRPNIVLLHAGTNDLKPDTATEPYEETPKRLGNLIDGIIKTCPDAVVIVAKLIQAANAEDNQRTATFNGAIPGVVQTRVDAGHKVTIVDQSVVGPDELIDGVHPTDAGYAHMGDVWFDGIKAAADKNQISPPVGPDPVQS